MLIKLWWKHKGQLLRNGPRLHRKLIALDQRMKNPTADKISPATFSDYRALRLEQGIKPKTINIEQEFLGNVFSTLISLGHYHCENPLAGMKKIKLVKKEMGFLHLNEIADLLSRLEGDNQRVTKLYLATGAGWSESASMTADRVIHEKVTFIRTKNGNNLTVPISPEMAKEITKDRRHVLFPNANYQEVRRTIKDVAPHLPDGQGTHVLRHTFASHFMMNGGNILALQKILGHGQIEQTMVYAHFAPIYLNDAVKFNPLMKLT
ncbi:tyrosine-type recombinase/integrase [Candidatus Sodalis pierantonius]|uniref:phage integrase n=1 Tax=Candidatus Sodalis pierantonii TaxID=1486991 RepID=UPI00046D95EA